jgi:hypothetical protein
MIRLVAASGLSNAAGQTRLYYHFDGDQFTDGHLYKVRGEITQTVASTIVLRIGTTSFGGATYVGTNIATAAGTTYWELDFEYGAVTQDDLFFFNNGGAAVGNNVIDIKNISIVDMDLIGSNSTAYAQIGGFKIDGDSLYSGAKVSDGTPAAAGHVTIGSIGYISANKFQVDSSGNAKFSGSISLASDIGGDPMEDTWEIDGGQLKMLGGAYIGGNTVTTFTNTVQENTEPVCFIAGTKILMSDNTHKNIEDIKLGDYVKSWNESTNEIIESAEVVELQQPSHPDMIDIEFENGIVNKNTYDHPYYVKDKGWSSHKPEWTTERYEVFKDTQISKLNIGDICYQIENNKLKELRISDITEDWNEVQTYIFAVDEYHTFFANDILVHNKLVFTQGHNYFASSSLNLQSGDAVKLDSNNFLEKTNSAKSTNCVGIIWDTMRSLINKRNTASGLELESNQKYNEQLSGSIHIDSFGTIITGSDYTLMKVASIGDSREYISNFDSGSNNVSVITGSMMGFSICNQGGLVSKGDLLCASDTAGYLMKQPVEYAVTAVADDGTPTYEARQNTNSFTVGKCMESCSFDSNGKVEGVYGYLYCG